MKLLAHVPSILRNKFLLAGTGFFVWMLFFDNDNLVVQMDRRKELSEKREGVTYYRQQIKENRQFSADITTNAAALEKYAREKFKMKREGEDVFVIQRIKE